MVTRSMRARFGIERTCREGAVALLCGLLLSASAGAAEPQRIEILKNPAPSPTPSLAEPRGPALDAPVTSQANATGATEVPPEAGSGGPAPETVVDGLHAGLLQIMREAETLGFEGRKGVIEPVLLESFDFGALTVGSVGRIIWSGWSDEERKGYASSFREFTIATYASQFDGYSGQDFATKGVEEGPGGTKLVKTMLERPKGEPIAIDYLLRRRKDDGRWAVIDIFLKGSISELARQRSQFGAVLKREGYEALVAALKAKTESFAAENSANEVGLGRL